MTEENSRIVMNSPKEKPLQTANEDLARLLQETNFFEEQNVKYVKVEQPPFQQLRLQFTRKSKNILTDGGNTTNIRRKRRKYSKSNVANFREENKENHADATLMKKSNESFLQEWHDNEVEIADYRSSDDSQDEQLEEWYKDLKSNKARDTNLPSVKGNTEKVGPVIRHESSTEGKSWLDADIAETYLLNMIAKYPEGHNPREIVFEDLMEPSRWIKRTHLIAEDIMLIKKHSILTILRQNRPRNLLTHLRLGYCVTHNPGRPQCHQEGQTCQLQCQTCGVCCHMYSCTCRLVKRFQWCSHIHAAVLCGGNKFKNDQQVYLHISSRYTQLAHLRATCYDMTNDVKPVENYENVFAVMGWATEWTPFSVLHSPKTYLCHLCPQYKRCPECSICRHQYLCACVEYIVKKRLCEHCHVVAIFQSENRVKILKKRDFHYLSDVSDDTDEEADPQRDVSPIMLPLRKLSARHEKSYSIPLRRIKAVSVDNQLSYFVQRCDPELMYVVSTSKRQYCTCTMESTFQNVNCIDCGICRHYLTCNCGKQDTEFCKHTHAVRRYIVRHYPSIDANAGSTLKRAYRPVVDEVSEDPSNSLHTTEKTYEGLTAVTEANIGAVVESLASVLETGSEVELHAADDGSIFIAVIERLKSVLNIDCFEAELHVADEGSISSNDSNKSKVHNLNPVLEDVNEVIDPRDEGSDKCHTKIYSCRILNSYFNKKDIHDLKPVLGKNCNDNFDTSEKVANKSTAEINGCSILDSNSTEKGTDDLESVLSNHCNNDFDKREIGANKSTAEIDGCSILLDSGSTEAGIDNLEPVLSKSCKDDFETTSLTENTGVSHLNIISTDRSQHNLKSGLEKNCNEISTNTNESAIFGKTSTAIIIHHPQFEQVQNKNFDDNSDGRKGAGNKSPEGIHICSHLNSNSTKTTVNILKPVQEKRNSHTNINEEYKDRMLAEAESYNTVDSNYKFRICNTQVEPVLKNGDDDIDAGRKGGDEASEEMDWFSIRNGNIPETLLTSESVLQNGGCNNIGIRENNENTVSPPLYDDNIKTLRTFYELKSQPVLGICYKGNSDTNEKDHRVLAESSRCRVTVNVTTKGSLPNSEPVLLKEVPCDFGTNEEDKTIVSTDTCGFSDVSKDFRQNSIKGKVLNSEPILLKNPSCGSGQQNSITGSVPSSERTLLKRPSCGSGTEEKDKDRVSSGTWGCIDVSEDFKQSSTKRSNIPKSKPVLLKDSAYGCGIKEKDEDRVSRETSECSNVSKNSKKNSFKNLIQKLNLIKYCRMTQKKRKILSRIFAYRRWTRSRRQRQFRILPTISEENSE